MARLRKAARVWKDAAARSLAGRALVAEDPSVFTVEPSRLFERQAPLEVELGAGKGDFIIERAGSMPERNFLAIELAGSVAQMLAVRVGRSELPNVRVMRADARTVVNLLLPDGSVTAYHIYFPDPWPKQRHFKHRLFTPHLVTNLKRTLCGGGRVLVATDVADYGREIFAMLGASGFATLDEPVLGADRSNFGRKYLGAGKALLCGAFAPPATRSWS